MVHGRLSGSRPTPCRASAAQVILTKGELVRSERGSETRMKTHRYTVTVKWTGNTGTGTSGYRNYGRQHEISAGAAKPLIAGSSDPAFRGDPARWNPEELLVASLSACHKLWYLHVCTVAGLNVLTYQDAAEGTMIEEATGAGRFTQAILRP